MKICAGCKIAKPLIEFYKDKRKMFGCDVYCKSCRRVAYRERRQKHKETFRRKEKRYYAKHRIEILERVKKYNSENPEKRRARDIVRLAKKKGDLIPVLCFCGVNSEAHHVDYSKPLEVVWLCKRHHRVAHGLLKHA